MHERPQADRLVEKALEHKGLLPLDFVLAEFVPLERLRALARERGLSTKGFRADAAPARVLAQALVRDLRPELLTEAAAELVARLAARPEAPADRPPPAPV